MPPKEKPPSKVADEEPPDDDDVEEYASRSPHFTPHLFEKLTYAALLSGWRK
jgi:hypothetical protein